MCQSCHVRAVSTYGTATQRDTEVRREGAAGLTTHARQAAQNVTLPSSLDEAVAALADMPSRRARGRRHRSDGGRQLGAAAPGRAGRPRPDQRDPRLAVPGRRTPCSAPASPTPAWAAPTSPRSSPRWPPPPAPPGRPQIRNAGTLGGNIVTAAPTGDALPVLAALEASVILAGPGGRPRTAGQPPAHRHGPAAPRRTARPSSASRCCTPRRSSSRPPAAPAPAAPSPPSRSSSTRPGAQVRCSVGAVAPDAAAAAGGRAVGRRADRLGRRARPGPRGVHGLRRVRRRGLHPRPAPGGRTAARRRLQLRRTVAALSRRALGRALA